LKRWAGVAVAAAAASVLRASPESFPAVAADARAELARATARYDSIAAAAVVGAEDALALGYLERLRLGLGSPFRLVDQARQDPRLTPAARHGVAWALLAHTLAGDSYEVEPAALDARPAAAPAAERPRVGARHLAADRRDGDRAPDPRAGELAVRLGYALGRGEQSVSGAVATAATQTAALVRDRELARQDAVRLLDAARTSRVDPLLLVAAWRAERRFAVERPPLADETTAAREADAVSRAEPVAAALRALDDAAATAAGADSARTDVPRARRAGWLSPVAAARLAELASARRGPPHAAVVMALRQQKGLAASPERFATRSVNEETLVAEAALASDRDSAVGPALLATAVALRAYGQESVWFPGSPAPTVAELKDRYELAALSFDRGVPAEWRPYYLRMLATSVEDLHRVFPTLSLRGVGVHFGESVLRDTVLALHDPGTRTIFLPVATSAGTIAHEIAHDLDWQAARRQRRVRGDYLTDRVVREGRGRLAAAIAGLTSNTLAVPVPGNPLRPGPTQRPTELFARSVDWLVAAALARDGRSNGYLSTVQDDVLAGYTLVAPPGTTGRSGQALVEALDDVAELAPGTRAWFVERYGVGRDVGAYARLRDVLVMPRSPRGAPGEAGVAPDRGAAAAGARRARAAGERHVAGARAGDARGVRGAQPRADAARAHAGAGDGAGRGGARARDAARVRRPRDRGRPAPSGAGRGARDAASGAAAHADPDQPTRRATRSWSGSRARRELLTRPATGS
jgi:hypothetical protein